MTPSSEKNDSGKLGHATARTERISDSARAIMDPLAPGCASPFVTFALGLVDSAG
jgi:hypothetical protein